MFFLRFYVLSKWYSLFNVAFTVQSWSFNLYPHVIFKRIKLRQPAWSHFKDLLKSFIMVIDFPMFFLFDECKTLKNISSPFLFCYSFKWWEKSGRNKQRLLQLLASLSMALWLCERHCNSTAFSACLFSFPPARSFFLPQGALPFFQCVASRLPFCFFQQICHHSNFFHSSIT